MSRALKDLVVACVLTLVGLAVGMLLAGADVHAEPVCRHTTAPQSVGSADAAGTKLARCARPSGERSVVHVGKPAAE